MEGAIICVLYNNVNTRISRHCSQNTFYRHQGSSPRWMNHALFQLYISLTKGFTFLTFHLSDRLSMIISRREAKTMSKSKSGNPTLIQQLETAEILRTLSQHRADCLSPPRSQQPTQRSSISRKRKVPSPNLEVVNAVSPPLSSPSARIKDMAASYSSSETDFSIPPLAGLGNISTVRVNPLRPPPKLRRAPIKSPITLQGPDEIDDSSSSPPKQFSDESSLTVTSASLASNKDISYPYQTSIPPNGISAPLTSSSASAKPCPNFASLTIKNLSVPLNMTRPYPDDKLIELRRAQQLINLNSALLLPHILANQVANDRYFLPSNICHPVGVTRMASSIHNINPSLSFAHFPVTNETFGAPAASIPLEMTPRILLPNRIVPQRQQGPTLAVNAAPPRKDYKECRMDNCRNEAVRRSPYCSKHSGPRKCEREGCGKCAQGRTRFCIAHGGGRRCQHEGCTKGARGRYFCAYHGGGRRCNVEGCNKLAVGKGTTCTAHGGGRRCQHEGCSKSAQSSSNFCVRHGGGRKCRLPHCKRVARGKLGLCMSHESQCERQMR